MGPLAAVRKLVPEAPWHGDDFGAPFPQPVGAELAKVTYRVLYDQYPRDDVEGDLVMRDEYKGLEYYVEK